MSRKIFLKEIITIFKEPNLCPNCNKNDKFEKDIISEHRSGGKTIFCSRCETLIVITNQKIKEIDLSSSNEISIMLKEPHLIRTVTY